MGKEKKQAKCMVYVAGPYSGGDVIENVWRAIDAGFELRRDSQFIVPVIPHLFHLAHMHRARSYYYWMAWDMDLLSRCDALLRLPGESPGADAEVRVAREMGIPVFFGTKNCILWARARCESRVDETDATLFAAVKTAVADDCPQHSWEGAESDRVLEYFDFEHLPAEMQLTGELFFEVAKFITEESDRTPEQTKALERLKDLRDGAVKPWPADECEPEKTGS
jgi:hypothetical protein